MGYRRVFEFITHWTLILIAVVKLVLDAPCWYFVMSEEHKLFFVEEHSFSEGVRDTLFYGMNLAMLKFILDVFMDLILIYAWYMNNRGLLILASTYNATVASLTVSGMWRVYRNFGKTVAKSVVNPFSRFSDSSIAELYLLLVFVAPYICAKVNAIQDYAVVILVTEFVIVHILVPVLLIREIKMVTRLRLQNRAILHHLIKNAAETVPMTSQNNQDNP